MAELTEQQVADAQTILEFFYGTSEAAQIKINERVVLVIGQMLGSAEQCSRAMDYVPRPSGTKPGLSYILRQLRDIARRVKNHHGIYVACRNAVANSWRTELRMASMGF